MTRLRFSKKIFLSLASVLVYSPARAEDWSITTSSFETKNISINRIDDQTITGKSVDQPEYSLPIKDFLEVSRPARVEAIKGIVLFTAGGDRLVGKPLKIEGSNLVWNASGIGDISIPLDIALGLAKGASDDLAMNAQHAEDQINLANGDHVSGIVTAISDKSITIAPKDGQPVDVPLDSAKQLYFTTPPQGRSQNPTSGFLVRLLSGAVISCQNLSLNDRTLDLTLAGGVKTKIDSAQVAVIEHLGASLSWLSSRKPEKIEYVPYFNADYQPQMDRTVAGKPIVFGDVTYHHGIGMHSRTRMTWKLDPSDKTFRTRYFIDPELGYADADVRVYIDQKKVYEALSVKAGSLSEVISADLTGAKTLTLEVDYGKGYDVQDRVNWIETAILRK